jgi:peroxiredoxin
MALQNNLPHIFLNMRTINNKKLLTLIGCFLALFTYAGEPVQTTITCKVYNNTGSAVALYKVENGEAVSLGFRRPGELDTCQFSLTLEQEGIYFLQKPGGKGAAYTHVIYLKPGDQKLVHITMHRVKVDFESCNVQSPNQETVILQKWADLLNGVVMLGMNRAKKDEFVVAYNKLVEQAAELKRKSISNKSYFKKIFALKLDADLKYVKTAAYFNYGTRMNSGLDSVTKRQQFYQPIAKQKNCNTGLLQSENGLTLLKYNLGYQLFQKYGTQEQMLATSFIEKMKMICNDTVRAVFALDRMKQITNYEQFKVDIEPFKNLFTKDDFKKAYEKKEDELTVFAKGAPAYNFSLKDTKDQTVSMSDFKGKVVVMDIWAMWCAPCLTEKPFFQKVEESFKDRNDIVFIGVSHDGYAKKGPWKDFVAKKGFTNIEVLSEYTESIGKYYKIDGIPRFLIFDKEGKIVTVDAPRPSDPAFKKLIDQTLGLK